MSKSVSFARADNRAFPSGSVDAVTGVGTAQVGAAALTGFINIVTTAVGQTAVILPSSFAGGGPILVRVTSATAGLVFPPTGGTINGGSTNASFSVAQNKPTLFYVAENGLDWLAVLSA